MTYNFRQFLKTTFLSFFNVKNTNARLTRKRVSFIALFYLIWPVYALFIRLSFILDDILFPVNKEQTLEKPLFILGNFRSGTTFLHRLLAKDHQNFTCLNTWEIFLAPAIIQRKFFFLLDKIDSLFGNPIKKAFVRFDQNTLGNVDIHKVGFFVPEEDENLMLHMWSSFFVQFMFPFWEDLPNYEYFDRAIGPKTRNKLMQFYRRCIQRHLYAHGGKLHLISKNPSFSPKIKSLIESIPEARIIYLVREPHEMLPSTISWLSYAWNRFGDPIEKYPYLNRTIAFTKYWYDHPLEVLSAYDPKKYLIIKYADLIHETQNTIQAIYQYFGYKLNGEFSDFVSEISQNEKQRKSQHVYSFQDMGLSLHDIYQTYQHIYERFDFSLPTQDQSI